MKRDKLELELLGEHIAMQAAHLDAALHRLLTDLRKFDEGGGWYSAGARSCARWLSWRVGWDNRTASEHVRVANALGECPLIDEALRRGEVSYSKVRAMTRVAKPDNEERLLEYARHATGAQLDEICRKYATVQRHDRDTTPDDDQYRRQLRWRDLEDGMVRMSVTLHPDEAAILRAGIERVASEQCRERAGDVMSGSAEPMKSSNIKQVRAVDSRQDGERSASGKGPLTRKATARAKSFDRVTALVEILQDVVRGDAKHRVPIDLMVTVAAETIQAAKPSAPARACTAASTTHDEARRTVSDAETGVPSTTVECIADPIDVGVFTDGTCISASAVRRVACDCGVIEVVEDDNGTPLSIGRKRRTISGSMKRALLRRDRTCRFPGCNTRVFLEGHHIEHWADGGKTEVGNLVCLCSWHHRHVHEYEFTMTMDSTSEIRFADARGRELRDVPIQHIGPALGWPTILQGNAELGITADTPFCGWSGDRVDYVACIDGLVAADGR